MTWNSTRCLQPSEHRHNFCPSIPSCSLHKAISLHMLKRPLPAGATRLYWCRRLVVGVALAWTLVGLAWIMLAKLDHKHLGQPVHGTTTASRVNQAITSSSSSSRMPAAAACDEAALPTPQQVEDMFLTRWGRRACLPLRKACLDQGTVVMYQPRPDGSWPLQDFQLGDNHLDFRGFGDIVGIIQYPVPILRPGTSDEEAPDLRSVKGGASPVFSNCSRPVVVFHNHLFMFGDFFMRIMPTYVSAIKAHTWAPEHTPAWDTRLSLVLATGGQRMTRWQKLMLAPLSQHPVVTLSAASSRKIPQQDHRQAGWSSDAGLAGGRCFESITLCSLSNPRGFPGSIDRPTWEGAQFIKAHWLARYGAYSYLPPDHALQQPGAFRVVFAVRDLTREATGSLDLDGSVRSILNLPQLLKWCNRWRPAGVDGRPDARYSRTVCIAHEFGRHGKVFTQPRPTAGGQQQQAGRDGAASTAADVAEATGAPAELPADPELDPRALLLDFAVADNTDVLVGLHGAQLMNSFFMPEHKSLVEVRPFAFNLGWPAMYFKEPIIEIDKAEGIFWWGIDTTLKANSKPGMWEAKGQGCCHERDRHTKIEPAALEYLFRRIIHSRQNTSSYMALVKKGEHFITDTLASGTQHENDWEDLVKRLQQQQQQQAG